MPVADCDGIVGMAGRGFGRWARGLAVGTIACAALSIASPPASADTLEGALVQAYQNNPSLNSQRASVRAIDEGVPQALVGLPSEGDGQRHDRPAIFRHHDAFGDGLAATYTQLSGAMTPNSYGVTATQTLYNGFQTANRTRQAESQVQAARETLRVTEQTVLLNAVTAYMNLLRDSAILDLQRRNVEVLQEQLRQTRDRFNVGEVTRTDVAQSESRLAAGRSQVLSAEADLQGVCRDLSSGDRGRAGQADAGFAGRPVLAAQSGRRRSGLPRATHPVGDQRAIQCRCRAVAGEGGGRRALSDAVGAGQCAAEQRVRACCSSRPSTPRCWASSAFRSTRAARSIR